MSTFDDTVADTVGVAPALGCGCVVISSNTIATSSTLNNGRIVASSDALLFELLDAVVTGWAVSASDTVGVAPTLAYQLGAILCERLRLANTLLANQVAHLGLAETLAVYSQMFPATPVAMSNTVAMSITQAAQLAGTIMEELDISSALVGSGKYHLTLAQTIGLVDALVRFFGEDLTDGIGVAEVLGVDATLFATATDTVVTADSITPSFLLSAVCDEGIDLSSVTVEQMLFSPTLQDGIEITAGYLEPDGSFTTWVMNARNYAVTEYQNYAFNSFAKLGDTYIGASDSGLYELAGDTDDGASIVARIKSGFMQFGGTHLSRLKGAYIAATGEGRMVLKIITKEGDTYIYQADTRDGRSTKVHMGKGQRSRYFAFELTSVGQDFDLDTLEFVPVLVQRRV